MKEKWVPQFSSNGEDNTEDKEIEVMEQLKKHLKGFIDCGKEQFKNKKMLVSLVWLEAQKK